MARLNCYRCALVFHSWPFEHCIPYFLYNGDTPFLYLLLTYRVRIVSLRYWHCISAHAAAPLAVENLSPTDCILRVHQPAKLINECPLAFICTLPKNSCGICTTDFVGDSSILHGCSNRSASIVENNVGVT